TKLIFTLSKKIDSNNRINQTLEQMAQALFKSWFVDFEPVKAKMAVLEAGGSQEDATLAAMSAISGKDADTLAVFEREHPEQYAELKATAELFPSAMQESELGEIPEGWDIKNIKSMSVALSKGTTPAKKDLSSEENQNINFLKVKDIDDDGRINFSNLDKISKRVHEIVLKRSVLQSNDILFSIAGTIGRVAVVASDMLACNCNQAIAFIRLKNCASHLNLVRLNLQSPRIQQEVESKVVQGVQANLSLTSLGELEVVLPSDCVLIAFNNVITPIWKQKLSITKSIMLLTQLRDTLLPKLLSGEITLPEAEQAVSEAENV
ncbi:restriction endonuclease subunit S, partial [Cronobacter malonaticus]